ncbi:hypothetical protein ACVT98_09520 [Vibrio campbellii]
MAEFTVIIDGVSVVVKDENSSLDECISKGMNALSNLGFKKDEKRFSTRSCVYAGEIYDVGAIIGTPGGNIICEEDGHWGPA